MSINLGDLEYMQIVNRNEKKIKQAIAEFLEDPMNRDAARNLTLKDLQDIYALSLNQLPARYAHSATIIVNEPVRPSHINDTIDKIVRQIISNPKE